MKFLVSALVLVFGLSAQAQIKGSDFSAHQQQAIVAAIENACFSARNLKQISQTEQVVVVDQGVRDVYYTTIIESIVRLDQNVFDRYVVTVKSVLADAYDHQNQVWGLFQVESVNCKLENN